MSEKLQLKIRQAASRNAELRQILASTGNAAVDHEDHTRFIKELETDVSRSNVKVNRLGQQRKAELKHHEKSHRTTVKQLLYKAAGKKDRFAEKAQEDEDQYLRALHQLQQEQARNASLKQELREARRTRHDMSRTSEAHKQAEKDLEHMYDSIFTGATTPFPELHESERHFANASQIHDECRERWDRGNRAYVLLFKASKTLQQAAAEMEEALSYGRADMMGGGGTVDMAKRGHLSSAQGLYAQASIIVGQAQALSPQIDNLAAVNINQGLMVGDVYFDNPVSDTQFYYEMKRAQAEMAHCMGALQTQMEQARRRDEATADELSRRETDLETSRMALRAERERVFDAVLSGTDETHEDPPPSFEEAVNGGGGASTVSR